MIESETLERHVSVDDIAKAWGLDKRTIQRKLTVQMPGQLLTLGHPGGPWEDRRDD